MATGDRLLRRARVVASEIEHTVILEETKNLVTRRARTWTSIAVVCLIAAIWAPWHWQLVLTAVFPATYAVMHWTILSVFNEEIEKRKKEDWR